MKLLMRAYMSSNNDVNVNGTENDEGNDRDDDDCDNDDNDDDERRTICSSSSGGCGVGALGGSSSCFSRAGTAFAARRVSVSRSLLRTWELLAVEVSRHLGNLPCRWGRGGHGDRARRGGGGRQGGEEDSDVLSGCCMMISERQGFWVRWSFCFVSEESSLELFGHWVKSMQSNCGKVRSI